MTGIYDADAELYRAWLAGNGTALESLVARYSDALVRFAYSYTGDEAAAEDVAADAFAVLVFKRRPFAEGARFRTYLYKIARNRALDWLRRNRRLTALPEGAPAREDAERQFFAAERDRTLFACMRRLAPQYREVLELTYFEGFTPAECAVILKKSGKQVYNLLARAKTSLKALLEKEGLDHEDV